MSNKNLLIDAKNELVYSERFIGALVHKVQNLRHIILNSISILEKDNNPQIEQTLIEAVKELKDIQAKQAKQAKLQNS